MTVRFVTAVCVQLILILSALDADAIDIPVVNNNDAGMGSFRWALEQAAANGPTEPDRIIFAIPGALEANQTISLLSALPALSSNLTIDGSTQAGPNFGFTNAKIRIRIMFDSGSDIWPLYGSGLENIEMYGMSFITGISSLGINALLFQGCKNIIVGAPGKGNHFDGVRLAVGSGYVGNLTLVSENVTIKSNIFGLSSIGDMNGAFIDMARVKNITIGGATEAEGNHIVGGLGIMDIPSGEILIAHNKFGVNFSGTQVSNHVGAQVIFSWCDADQIDFVDNQMAGLSWLGVSSSGIVNIKRNKFGTDPTGTQVLGINGGAIQISNRTGRVMIGGPDPLDGNLISGCHDYNLSDFEGRLSCISNFESANVEVINNIFRCNNVPRTYASTLPDTKPTITARNTAVVRGTALPGSRVDLYYSLSCTFCEPEQLFASVITDVNGDWSYLGIIQDLSIIAAATLNGQTSEFSSVYFDYNSNDIVIKPACGNSKGSIKGLKYINAASYGWYNEQGMLVSNEADLVAVPGKYQFRIGNEKCEVNSPVYEIPEIKIYVNAVQITPQSCGEINGAIRGVETNAEVFTWYDQNNNPIGSNRYIDRVEAGSYTLLASIGECSEEFGPFVVPALDGIVTIDGGPASVADASCDQANGSIKGVLVNGAEKYEWLREDDSVFRVTETPELLDAPSGKYRLRASSSVCEQFSDEFTIRTPLPVSFANISFNVIQPCSGKMGSISIDLGEVASQIQDLDWRNVAGEPLGSAKTLNIGAGTYLLYLRDVNGCHNLFRSFDVNETVPMTIDESAIDEADDYCASGHGSITGLVVSGGYGPRIYTWRNSAGVIISSSPDLVDVGEGIYTLEVSDDSQCRASAGPFLINNDQEQLSPPILVDVSICAAGDAVIAVESTLPGTYVLYRQAIGGIPLLQNNTGVFNVVVSNETSFYVALSNGTCESSRSKVVIKVEDPKLMISNAFSPNGDGNNDAWIISDLERYPQCNVSIYNRAGLLVYSSSGYKSAFDGKLHGADLPVGVYYYVIRLRGGCKEISGSLTIVR